MNTIIKIDSTVQNNFKSSNSRVIGLKAAIIPLPMYKNKSKSNHTKIPISYRQANPIMKV